MVSPYKNIMVCILLLLTTLTVNYPELKQVSWLKAFRPSNVSYDNIEYMKYVEYFRNQQTTFPERPFSYRPLTPYIASLLPFEPRTSINLINISAIYLAAIIIFIMASQYFNGFIPIACDLLFLVSFPTFYYCSDAAVDSLSILVITLLLWFTLTQKTLLFGLYFMIGVFAKETTVIAIVPFFVYNILQSNFKRAFFVLIALLSFFVLQQIVIRHWVSHEVVYQWYPKFNTFYNNITRPRATISFILSLGIPGFIACMFLIKQWRDIIKNNILITLYTGFLCSIILYIYAMFSAYADGRFVWTAYPSICLIGGFYLNSIKFQDTSSRTQ